MSYKVKFVCGRNGWEIFARRRHGVGEDFLKYGYTIIEILYWKSFIVLSGNKGVNPFTGRGVLFEFFTWIETIRTDIKYDIVYAERKKSLSGVLFSFVYPM